MLIGTFVMILGIGWSPIRSVIIRVTKKNWTTAKQESNLLITSMITERIGRQEVLLPINHNCFDFRKQQIHLGLISPVATMSKVKKFLHLGNS